jgi:1-acyl-sn-glycerol-3-phosphate acyltransferase
MKSPNASPNTLYRVLRQGLRWALDFYFVEIRAAGAEQIPAQGPVIFAANHPNSIMDTVLLGTQTPRQIHYMARAGLFHNPLVARLFDACGVIPIFRAQDAATEGAPTAGGNDESFRRAFDVLAEQKCLGIFPEGQNSRERQVLEIKTGTARIALGAEHREGWSLGVQIIPVGLNFEDRDQFLTSVLIRFGQPIHLRDWEAAYSADPRAAARALTDAIQAGIQAAATHVEDDQIARLVEDIITIKGRELLERISDDDDFLALLPPRESIEPGWWSFLLDQVRSTSAPGAQLNERFALRTHLANRLSRLKEADPDALASLRRAILRYQDHLRQVHVRHDFGNRHPGTLSSRKDALRLTMYAVCFGPLAAWGFLINALPYQLTKLASLRANEEAIRAMTAFLAGLVLFPLTYAAQSWLAWRASGGDLLITLIALIAAPVSGFFFLRYRRVLGGFRDRILTRTLFRTQKNLVKTLLAERQTLLNQVDLIVRDEQARQKSEL